MTISSSLYGRARSTLEAKAKSGADYFSAYSMGSYSEYYRRAAQYTADFSHERQPGQDRGAAIYQRQAPGGAVLPGAVAGSTPATMDVNRAVETGKTASIHRPGPLTGENILAVSSPCSTTARWWALCGYVTSPICWTSSSG